jgi:hypothetical protein
MADGPSDNHSGGSLFPIAPPVCCLDIVGMIVSPRSSHPFGILVIRHNVGVVRELFVTDGALPVLLHNLKVQESPHLRW